MSGKKLPLHLSILIGILIFIPVPALAEALSGAQIEKLIRSAGPLIQLEDKYDLPEKGQGNAEIGPMSHALNNIKGHKAYGDFLAIIKKAGFASAEEWAHVGDRVLRAYVALILPEKSQGEMQTQIAQAMKQLEDNPYITAEQKQMMMAQMEKSMPMMNGTKYTSPEDMEVVRPYMVQLKKTFEPNY